MEIPQRVIDASQEMIDTYGNHLQYNGHRNGFDVYVFDIPDNDEDVSDNIWFCLDDGSDVSVFLGFEAVSLRSSYVKDAAEVSVE